MELGKKIKQLRFKAKLTQEQLGESLGVGAQAVSKWENGASMPDISLLPQIAEVFGVTIDDLFDLTTDQRFNRIENRMDIEEELPQDVFCEFEEYLKAQYAVDEHKERATDLLAYLYWHRMTSYGKKTAHFAKESVRMHPDKKNCQWMMQKPEGHAVWDWNFANHKKAIDFYSDIVKDNPNCVLALEYLLDNLIADHRADEAEKVLAHLQTLPGAKHALNEAYRAHIALDRFDEHTADCIMEKLIKENPSDSAALFETAQYYAKKCNYEKAIALYERSFECTPRKPRYQDELMAISHIYQIMGDYKKAAETYARIVDLLENEWGMTEDTELKFAKEETARLTELGNRH